MLRQEWTCLGRLDELGLSNPTGLPCWTSAASPSWSPGRTAWHALANVCRHRGSQLIRPGSAPCPARALRCPYHSWTYALDGSLMHAPHADDLDADSFRPHQLVRRFLGVGGSGSPKIRGARCSSNSALIPSRISRYPLSDLKVGLRMTYAVDANWKVIAENYNECYHCGPVHPELSRLVPAFAGGGQDIPWADGVPHREGAWTFTLSWDYGSGTLSRPRRARARPAQGRARSTPTCCSACRPSTRPHSGSRPWRSIAPAPRLRAAVPSHGDSEGVIRPQRRRGPVGPGEPPGLGRTRIRPARDEFALLPRWVVRPDGGRLPGHPALAVQSPPRRIGKCPTFRAIRW
jgi:phenylpropionate dioxygenase-like ring-hydroxylating dioxygenase large terminal subunit